MTTATKPQPAGVCRTSLTSKLKNDLITECQLRQITVTPTGVRGPIIWDLIAALYLYDMQMTGLKAKTQTKFRCFLSWFGRQRVEQMLCVARAQFGLIITKRFKGDICKPVLEHLAKHPKLPKISDFEAFIQKLPDHEEITFQPEEAAELTPPPGRSKSQHKSGKQVEDHVFALLQEILAQAQETSTAANTGRAANQSVGQDWRDSILIPSDSDSDDDDDDDAISIAAVSENESRRASTSGPARSLRWLLENSDEDTDSDAEMDMGSDDQFSSDLAQWVNQKFAKPKPARPAPKPAPKPVLKPVPKPAPKPAAKQTAGKQHEADLKKLEADLKKREAALAQREAALQQREAAKSVSFETKPAAKHSKTSGKDSGLKSTKLPAMAELVNYLQNRLG